MCSMWVFRNRHKKDPATGAGSWKLDWVSAYERTRPEELPGALLVAIGLQALAALVVVHFETAFLFEVTHIKFAVFVRKTSNNSYWRRLVKLF